MVDPWTQPSNHKWGGFGADGGRGVREGFVASFLQKETIVAVG